mmetsp:Transcript_48577/g.72079  ORF Transcript_48577/g.72079 Transcript_48577/m.72079 type:complete len:96 (-) Transcript_48577:50-337(-)
MEHFPKFSAQILARLISTSEVLDEGDSIALDDAPSGLRGTVLVFTDFTTPFLNAFLLPGDDTKSKTLSAEQEKRTRSAHRRTIVDAMLQAIIFSN